ncbi:MAG: sialate O-acetylesterase [Candidatus Marinimicrobia bacterium]|nr:sialate O-acetylesterase [Candidatus Neomarinimicrobiota bacterium]
MNKAALDMITQEQAPARCFLLIGQSNMAGRGPLDTVPALPDPNIRMFRDGHWIEAREPLHTDKPEVAGIGLGMSFAQALLLQEPGPAMGLIPCAVGGTPLARWMPQADLYTQAVTTVRAAGALGKVEGILWHQGEGDAQQEQNARSYGRRLAEMIAALRADLRAPTVPFVAGELGAFLKDHETCHAFFAVVNGELRALCDRVPAFRLAKADGLTDKGDAVHFDSPALREFGQRYAREFLALKKGMVGK